jgi:hypothetical protein
MGQYQNLNQFQQAPILGDSATKVNLNTLSVQVDPNSTNTILAGDAVYMTTTSGTTILVDKCTATVQPLGYVFYSLKYDQFVAGDNMEIGLVGSILYAQADGTITRGNNLEYVPSANLVTGPRMLVSGGVNPISGLALDNATDTQIFRFIVIGSAAVSGTFSGGTINNTTIGASTPSTGKFTALETVVTALSTGTTSALNPNLGGVFTLTPIQSTTINASAALPGSEITIIVTTNTTTAYTVTFGTNFRAASTLSTGTSSGKAFILSFQSEGTNWYEVARSGAL